MTKRLSGKTVAIMVAHEFEDVELLFPLLRLSEEGADILVVPVEEAFHPRPHFPGKPVTGRFGHTVPLPIMIEGKRHSVRQLEDLSAADVDCVMIPGGYCPDILRLHEPTLEFLRDCHEQGKVLAAICHGPWVLISAGVMEGKQCTSYAALKDDLLNAGASYIDAPAVRDGSIVTGRMPDDLPEFCKEIAEALSN